MTTPLSFFARCGLAWFAITAATTSALAAPNVAPPVAPVRDTAETMHGTVVHDPYRYFENVKDPEVQAWMKGQGAYSRDLLDRIEGREQLQKRIAEISAATGDSVRAVVRMPGDKLFYLKRARGANQYKLMMRSGLHGREQVLVDPEADAKRTGVAHAVNYFSPSWDSRYLAYGMSAGGSEDASLYILDVASGKSVGAPIPRVREGVVSWLPDSKSFTYNQLKLLTPEDADTETYLDSRVMWLRVGEPETTARPVFGPTVSPQLGLARLDVGAILFAPGSSWMIARTTDTTLPEGALYLARVSDLSLPRVPWKKIATPDDRIVEIELKGDELYYRMHRDAPSYKLMKLDLRTPDVARATEVALPPEASVIEGFVLGRAGVIAAVREGTSIGLRRYAPGDRAGKPIALPFPGAARLFDDPAHAHVDSLFSLSGWAQPARVMRLQGNVVSDAGLVPAASSPTFAAIEVTDVKVASHDGVLVPMTIIHKKGLKRDGSNPTLLRGYASYGHSETAYFDAGTLAWIEQGGVVAKINARGSGVYGEPWRLAGQKDTKPNTWKDGIAGAQFLIAQGYASPRTLAAIGGSAGGIFVGRMITAAPQLFAAGITVVGVMDAVRAEDTANGITNTSEFGSYRNAKEFPALLEMSTYHQIRDGTAYPAVLAVHGMNDPRVDVWQSAKAVARFQAASTSGKPVLLRLDAQAGHGIGSTARQRDSMSADIYSFLLWQMGKRRLVD